MKNKIIYCEIFSTWPEYDLSLTEYKLKDPNRNDDALFQRHVADFRNEYTTEPFFIMTKEKDENEYIIHENIPKLYHYLKNLNDRITLIFSNEMVGRATILKKWLLNDLNFHFVKFRDYDYGYQEYIIGNTESFTVKDHDFMMNVIDLRDKGKQFHFPQNFLLNIQSSNDYPTDQEIEQVKHHLNIIEKHLNYRSPTNFSKKPFKYLKENNFEPLRKPKKVKMKITEVLDHWENGKPIIRKETEEERQQRLNDKKNENKNIEESISAVIQRNLRKLSFLEQMEYLKKYEDIKIENHNKITQEEKDLIDYFKENYINNLKNSGNYYMADTDTGQIIIKINDLHAKKY